MIKIENQALNLKQLPVNYGPLSDNQKLYLGHLLQRQTICQMVETLLGQGRLVNFNQLYDLVKRLHEDGLVQNPAVSQYFEKIRKHENPSKTVGSLLPSLFKKAKPEEYLQRHPFFRSQSPVVTALFCQHAEVIEAKPGTRLCQAFHMERDLYFMIEGEAAIYKPSETGGRRLLGFFGKDAVIGEVGFFMGELRTADVVTTKASKLVRIRYDEGAFGRTINKEIASRLQVRFRVVHALAKSPFLKNIPEEALDSLIFSGKVRQAQEFEILCKEGETGDRCFVVVSGSVVVSKGPKNIGVLGPGEAFGEIALFFTQGLRTATVMAQRETTLLEIQAKDFYHLLAENLLLAKEFEKLALERSGQLRQAA